MKILFVDDALDTREIYRKYLTLHGHTVQVAENGVEAVTAVEAENFDVVVLDMAMPVMSGWEALDQIRLLPKGGDVPVIFFTAYFKRHIEERAIAAGANMVLSKPMMPAELLEAIQHLQQARGSGDAQSPTT